MELVNIKAERYAEEFTSVSNEISAAVAQETIASHAHAHMLSGQVQGMLLEMIVRMIRPMRILEIGTFTGFSAICLAAGMPEGSHLHTIEIREEDAAIAENNFTRAGISNKISIHVGDAREVIRNMHETWDLVFIDADKVSYIEYYELTLPLLKQDGFILADNVFFHGQVLEKNVTGKNAVAINAFNHHVKNDQRVQQIMLTVRDGLMLIRKK